jgi:hypothetical protein
LQVSADVSGLTLTATSNSTLTVTYEAMGPRVRDTLDLSITVNGIHIAGSPFSITVATRCGVGEVRAARRSSDSAAVSSNHVERELRYT